MGVVYLAGRVARGSPCSGEFSLCVNVGINAVFLSLFVQFYRKPSNYRAGKGKKA